MKLSVNTSILVVLSVVLLVQVVSAEELSMAAWGGGTVDVWKNSAIEPFEKETGISSIVHAAQSPAISIVTHKGDPAFNLAIVTMLEAAKLGRMGLIKPLSIEEFPYIKTVPRNTYIKSPNDDSKVLGIPVYFAYYGITINTNLVSPEDFSSWHDLADPKWKNKIAVTKPVYAAFYDLTMYSHIMGGDESNFDPGLPLLEKISKNALTVYNGMAQLNQLLQRGAVVAAPYYNVRAWQMNSNGIDYIKSTIPKEGGLFIPYMVVIPKGAENTDVVKKFLHYIIQPEVQLRFLENAGELPLNPKVEVPPALKARLGGSLEELKERLYIPNWSTIYSEENMEKRLDAAKRAMAAAR